MSERTGCLLILISAIAFMVLFFGAAVRIDHRGAATIERKAD